jgi:hypothetical protein
MSSKLRLGDIIIALTYVLVYPTHFSAITERKSMKLHRNDKHYE